MIAAPPLVGPGERRVADLEPGDRIAGYTVLSRSFSQDGMVALLVRHEASGEAFTACWRGDSVVALLAPSRPRGGAA